MINKTVLHHKIDALPDNLKKQVEEFIDRLTVAAKGAKHSKSKPRFGSGKGMFVMAPDFDEPLEDFKEHMY